MQEWMIAMLVISIMLIIRDMAKTILAENLPDTEELPSLQEGHPQKERVEKYAASFQKLADTFYGMPYRKDYLSSRQVEQIIEDTNAKVCSRCYQREICWGEHSQELVKGVEALVRSMESGNEENVRGIRADWTGICPRSVQYYETVAENFQKERQNLMWDNRMIENRLAVAQQLMEVSHIMENVASDLYDLERVTPQFEEELRKGLRKSHVILRRAWMMNKVKGRKQIFLTMRARSGQCISMTEIAQLLSKYCEISMVPVNGSRCIVNGEYHTVHFAEDVSYQVLYGTARLTREGSMQGERDSCGTSGTVYGVRIFPGNGSKDGKFCSGTQRRGGYVFYSGYLRSGPVYRNLQFSEGGGSVYIYQKRSLGGIYYF